MDLSDKEQKDIVIVEQSRAFLPAGLILANYQLNVCGDYQLKDNQCLTRDTLVTSVSDDVEEN